MRDVTNADRVEILMHRLYRPMLFYIPHSLMPDLSKEAREEMDEREFFNTLVLFETNGEIAPFKLGPKTMYIYGRESQLKANLIDLLEMRSNMSREAFRVILNDYQSMTLVYEHMFEYLHKNYLKDVMKGTRLEKDLLRYQLNNMRNHTASITESFRSYKTNIEPEIAGKLVSVELPEMPTTSSHGEYVNAQFRKTLLNTIDKIKPNTKKLPIISDSEADLFLLRTVFGVHTSTR